MHSSFARFILIICIVSTPGFHGRFTKPLFWLPNSLCIFDSRLYSSLRNFSYLLTIPVQVSRFGHLTLLNSFACVFELKKRVWRVYDTVSEDA
jgi:hypothetical protein